MINNQKTLRITQLQPWDWKKKLGWFAAVFGLIWLFLDPLFTMLNFESWLDRFGVVGYIAIYLLSYIIVMVAEGIDSDRKTGKLAFVHFEVVLTESGERHCVEAPYDMLVKEFTENFLENVSTSKKSSMRIAARDFFNNKLLINTGGIFQPTSDQHTLREAGITENAECRIEGEIKLEHARWFYLHPIAIIIVFLLLWPIIKALFGE